MAEFTPTTSQVRDAYVRQLRNAFIASTGEHGAEFDRWFASVRAEAWDEGFDAGELDAMENHATFDEACIPNPYREDTDRG